MIYSSTSGSTGQIDVPVSQSGHLLQSPAWGTLKNHFGWMHRQMQIEGAAAQILFRRLPLGQTIGYIPKGPLVDWENKQQCCALFSAIHTEARKQRSAFLKVEPHAWLVDGNSDPQAWRRVEALINFFRDSNFIPADTIQPQTSVMVDISGDEDSILAGMKQKTRYNIRLAEKKGVVVYQGDETDIPDFYQLSQLTAVRDGFGIHNLDYYKIAYQLFSPRQCALILARFEGELLAALMIFSHAEEAYYFYGASSNSHRNLMASYLAQWAAIRWAKAQGCRRYDLWGIPDTDPALLEAEFAQRSDGLWGVYRFKRGFGGQIVKSVGAYDYIYNPFLYRLYKLWRKTSGLKRNA